MASVNIVFNLRDGSKHTISHQLGNDQNCLSLENLKNSLIFVHEESNDFLTRIVDEEKIQCKSIRTESFNENDEENESDGSDENDNTDDSSIPVEKNLPPLKKIKT